MDSVKKNYQIYPMYLARMQEEYALGYREDKPLR